MSKPLDVVMGAAKGAVEGRVSRARVDGGSGGRFEGVVRWSSAAEMMIAKMGRKKSVVMNMTLTMANGLFYRHLDGILY